VKVTLADIQRARERIAGVARKTPLEVSAAASQVLGTQVYLKCENLQLTGSFKIRGALNKISSLTAIEKNKGIIAASAGNHAQGVALSATKLNVKARVVMPKNSSLFKQTATRNYGAEVVLHGEMFDEAYSHARELEKQTSLVFIHPYEDELVLAGQGTVSLEIFEEQPELNSLVIPIGGGGLISGMAVAMKELNPNIKIFGVVAENAPAMRALFKNEPLKKTPSYLSVADGIAVKKPSDVIYRSFISKYVDDIVSVSEDEIAEAIVFLLERSKMVVEGSGAVTYAAALKLRRELGAKTGLVLSGGNIDLNLMGEIIDRGLSRTGRIARVSVVVTDRPGTLSRLTKIIGDLGANILDVTHDRMHPSLQIREAMISFVLETRDADHAEQIRAALAKF
jgi:threonine dehydratase